MLPDFRFCGIILKDVISVSYTHLIEENGDIKQEARDLVDRDLRGHFRPEFLNRLDEIIMFKPLTKDNIGGIVELLLDDHPEAVPQYLRYYPWSAA